MSRLMSRLPNFYEPEQKNDKNGHIFLDSLNSEGKIGPLLGITHHRPGKEILHGSSRRKKSAGF